MRILRWALATLLLVVLAAWVGIGWYYADELLLVPEAGEPEYPAEVVAVERGQVTLSGPDAELDGAAGLDWEGGYARVGPVRTETDDGIVRDLEPFPDLPSVGERVRLDFHAAPADLASVDEDADVQSVAVAGELGRYPATYVPGEDRRWVIFVHGRGGTRSEAYRLLPAVAEAGHPSLSISYRNDEGAPADPRGEFGLGWTEATDLWAAVDFAHDNGAEDVVLVGYSMGGAVVGNYLRLSGGEGVAGVIYDSPVLRWSDAIRTEAMARDVPTWLTPWAQTVVALRTGIRFDLLDQVGRADDLEVPILLFHGEGDQTVPVETSDALADARPDLVTYVRDGQEVGHVRSWNHDPQGYEEAVDEFLDTLD